MLDDLLAKSGARTVSGGVRRREPLTGLDMRPVLGKHAEQAAEMLESWFTATRTGRIDGQQVRTILNTIGWNVTEVQARTTGSLTWVSVTADPLRDRFICPVAAFGSQANGRYRILSSGTGPTKKDTEPDRRPLDQSGYPCILFRKTDPSARRDCYFLSHEKRRRFHGSR